MAVLSYVHGDDSYECNHIALRAAAGPQSSTALAIKATLVYRFFDKSVLRT